MRAHEIRIQAWLSIAAGLLLFALGVVAGSQNSDVGSLGLTATCLAFVGIGLLGFAVLRAVRALEDRLARLEQSANLPPPPR